METASAHDRRPWRPKPAKNFCRASEAVQHMELIIKARNTTRMGSWRRTGRPEGRDRRAQRFRSASNVRERPPRPARPRWSSARSASAGRRRVGWASGRHLGATTGRRLRWPRTLSSHTTPLSRVSPEPSRATRWWARPPDADDDTFCAIRLGTRDLMVQSSPTVGAVAFHEHLADLPPGR